MNSVEDKKETLRFRLATYPIVWKKGLTNGTRFSRKYLEGMSFMTTFAAEKHNSITNHNNLLL